MCKCFFFKAEDGIRDLVRSRGLGDVYKRQAMMQLQVMCVVHDMTDMIVIHGIYS